LQRAITDFAADQSFALARIKLQEHYGFMIGESTIQRIVLGHPAIGLSYDMLVTKRAS
jgi:hypothetical protein